MTGYNPENERVKKQYEEALLHGRHRESRTVDAVWRAINSFEQFTERKSFKTFNTEQAKGFKRWLAKQVNSKGQPLSLSTVRSTLSNLRDFFAWLVTHPQYVRKVDGRGIDYMRLSDNEERAGRATREKIPPTVEEVRRVLENMPFESEIERRDRAIVAFILLTGVRDGALISLKHKDFDLDKREIWQDPKTLQFEASGLSTEHWANATPVREIFHRAFIAAGLPKCQPHTMRNTITIWAQDNCSQLQFKAISQSLGHKHAMTTYNTYGNLPHHDVRKACSSIGTGNSGLANLPTEAILAEISRRTN